MDTPKIYIAGHRGMVGSTVLNAFRKKGYQHIITRSSDELDLRKQARVNRFISTEKPDVIILAAARVGGILANDQYPYPFIYDNLSIQNNVINAAHKNNVAELIFLGSSCIYPKEASQPLKEEYLLTGSLEPTNQWYAIAKIAGIKLCQALRKQYGRKYVALMPTNLYGPRDNFDLETSHVVPAMIRKFHEAKESGDHPVILWGTGNPRRELLHVNDLAKAVLFAVENQLSKSIYNIGTGQDLTIKALARLIQDIVGHEGEIIWDKSKPDGTPRKVLDVSRIHAAGWHNEIGLEEGLRDTYKWFVKNKNQLKEVKI
ncbi:GDP-L-fucose synthase family protein [Fodinibius saliphilus]|uniref:GDP-L-fucose synthase family protein n=1 Tax=Fodinibius saliphilus TaxID=1920650 RepID=UPI001107E9DF|nr:GDP-L-fucose synthase [Fodinibius saliphilus]